MPLSSGEKLGPYEILAPLGAGGMGEVYRARDTRLGRSVAVKVLPESVSGSAEHRQRFEREARAIAALNHPNICTLHDVGRSGETDYLVMELVEGETLAERLRRGPLPAADVVRIGAEVARALARAHRAGVLHRDLKPGNIMLTKTGAKLMDFGLARLSPVVGAGDLSKLATQTAPITGEGRIVGTIQYMSPEQLEGRELDARSDIWSLGATLYEMATGRRAFEGASTASVISSIMREEPQPIAELAPLSPSTLDLLVRTCLAKDPEERWQSAADVGRALAWVSESPGEEISAAPGWAGGPRQFLVRVLLPAVLLVGLGSLVGWSLQRPSTRSQQFTQSSVILPMDDRGFITGGSVAMSPDGSTVAVVMPDSSERQRIILRKLGSETLEALDCPHGASLPFWSPDSRELAYVTEESKLVRRAVSGGPEQVVCAVTRFRGGSWGKHGEILFAAGPGAEQIFRIDASGGAVQQATWIDTAKHERLHLAPAFLPDGEHFIYSVTYRNSFGFGQVKVGSIKNRESKDLFRSEGAVRVSPDGVVVYVQNRVVLAQRIAADGSRLLGRPIALPGAPERKTRWSIADACAAVAPGVVVFPTVDSRLTEYRWYSLSGTPGPALARLESEYYSLEPAPDGTRAIAAFAAGVADVYLTSLDLSTGRVTRLTAAPDGSRAPLWFADSRRVAMQLFGSQGYQLITIDVEDPSVATTLFAPPLGTGPTDLLGNGECIALDGAVGGGWLPVARADEGWRLKPFLGKNEPGYGGRFFAGGEYLVYALDAAGGTQLVSDRYPSRGRRRILTREPVGWTSATLHAFWIAGDQLIYLAADNRTLRSANLLVVNGHLEAGPPTTLFAVPPDCRGIAPSADGRRFLVATPVGPKQRPSLVLLQNWERLLERH